MSSVQRFIAVVVKHRRFIFWDVLLVTIAMVIYSLIARPVYTAQAQILPPTSDEPSLLSIPSMLGSLGLSSTNLRLGGSLRGTQISDIVSAILTSRTIAERVMDSCGFMTRGKFKSREAALKELSGSTKVGVTDEGIITLAVKGGTRDYAAQLANSYITELDRFLRESNMSRGRNMRIFVGRRLAENEADLAVAEESLTAFQKRNRITDADAETKAAIETYAKLEAEKIAQDVELKSAEELSGDANPYVQMLRQRSAQFDRQLTRFESDGASRFGIGLGIPLKGVPDLVAEYARRLSDYKMKEELRALLVQQYEQARITEVRDTPTLTILDPPKPPERRSAPKRTQMCLMAFAVSLCLGILLSFLSEYWEQQRRDENTWHEWQRIAHTLKIDRGLGRRVFDRPPDPKAGA